MFNLSALISGPAKTANSNSSYVHGINVLLINGNYKGYYGIVNDFFPASYDVFTTGHEFVTADKFGPIKTVGNTIQTNFGVSIIEKYIPKQVITHTKSPKLVFYKNDQKLQIGLIIKDFRITDKLSSSDNTLFILPLTSTELADQFSNLSINSNSNNNLLEQLSQLIQFDNEFLHTITHTRYIENIEKKLIVLKNKDVIGKPYYINTNNLQITPYNPSKDIYYISYTNVLSFKPNMLQILDDKRYVTVKKGPFATGMPYKIKKYNQARLSISLFFNGKTITNHIVNNKNQSIYPSDVFYMDIELKNKNIAQVVKITNNQLEIIEKKDMKYIKNTIHKNDILQLLQGFTFNTKNDSLQQEKLIQEEGTIYKEDIDEIKDIDEDIDEDSVEHDYGAGEQIEIEIEIDDVDVEQKVSFADTQRSSILHQTLDTTQQNIKNQITKIFTLLQIGEPEEPFNIYTCIDTIIRIIHKIQAKNTDFSFANSEVKYIILLVLFYNGISTLNLDKLYPKYFYQKDTIPKSLNRNIFLNNTLLINNDVIIQQIKDLKNSPIQIIKIILENAHIVLQDILQHKFTLNFQNTNTIPITITYIPLNNKRNREQGELELLQKTQKAIKLSYLSFKDLQNNTLSLSEKIIIWNPNHLSIITSFQDSLQHKYNTQHDIGYLYIKDNLKRAPFALQNDKNISPAIHKTFTSIYKLMLHKINLFDQKQQQIQHKIQQDKQKVQQNRQHIITQQQQQEEEEEEQEQVKNTSSYIREHKKRAIATSIDKASRNSYKYGPQ